MDTIFNSPNACKRERFKSRIPLFVHHIKSNIRYVINEIYPVIDKYFVSSTRMKSEDVLYVQRTLNRLAAARR